MPVFVQPSSTISFAGLDGTTPEVQIPAEKNSSGSPTAMSDSFPKTPTSRTHFRKPLSLLETHVAPGVKLGQAPTAGVLQARPPVVKSGVGRLRVPLDPNRVQGEQIELTYEWSRPFDARKTTVILLQGGPGFDRSSIRELAHIVGLDAHFNVLTFNRRGTNPGDPTSAEEAGPKAEFYQMQYTAKDLEALRREVIGQDKIILVGHSYGASLAYDYATQYPERISKLVVAAGSARATCFAEQARTLAVQEAQKDTEANPTAQVQHPGTPQPAGTKDPLQYEYINELVVCTNKVTAQSIDSLGLSPEEAQQVKEFKTELLCPTVHLPEHPFDLEDKLANISAPVLIIGGDKDRLTPPRFLVQDRDKLRETNSQVSYWIRSAGHGITDFAFSDVVNRFLVEGLEAGDYGADDFRGRPMLECVSTEVEPKSREITTRSTIRSTVPGAQRYQQYFESFKQDRKVAWGRSRLRGEISTEEVHLKDLWGEYNSIDLKAGEDGVYHGEHFSGGKLFKKMSCKVPESAGLP